MVINSGVASKYQERSNQPAYIKVGVGKFMLVIRWWTRLETAFCELGKFLPPPVPNYVAVRALFYT